jgi:ribosomal protein L11 methyltransferase
MNNYTAFTKTNNEYQANIIGSSLERMSPRPIGVGIFEIEDGSGVWEIGGFFSQKPNLSELTILEFAHGINFLVSKIVNKDWISKVQRDLTPVKAGRFILFGAHDENKIPLSAFGLKIEAAMAFGTGHHGTTVGCLLALDYLTKTGYKFKNILDIGCGTGVLAMAAARVSQAKIIATDIDEVAIETARVNILANGFATRIRLVQSRGFQKPHIFQKAPYDLIFGNILANPLCLLARDMAKFSERDGLIILSGILNRQANRVERYYFSNGFSRVFVQKIGEWTTIIMRR